MGKIMIFDSGVGGITVLEELYKLLPKEEYVYFGDSLNAPYGDKSEAELRVLAFNIIDHFLDADVKMFVIACNTVTSFLYKEIVRYVNVPVVGVIYPTIDCVNDMHVSKVGLIATDRTIESNTYQKMIDKEVIALKTPQLVKMIEDQSYVNKTAEIGEILTPILEQNVHVLVLGCTHYPFIKEQIAKFYHNTIIESGFVTALEVKKILTDKNLLSDKLVGSVVIYISGDVTKFESIIANYISFPYKIEQLILGD